MKPACNLIGAAMVALIGAVAGAQDAPERVIPDAVPLWENGAPGFEDRAEEAERMETTSLGSLKVYNVHNPSITPYLPEPDVATGAAVILMPGGGHRELNVSSEGYDLGPWLAERGIAAFVLKYRLSAERGSPYRFNHAVEDAFRAIRLVKHNAEMWHVDPDRVGVMGFSAGGQLAMIVAQQHAEPHENPADEIDRIDARPSFQALIYPGSPRRIEPNGGTPPTFMAVGYNDRISDGLAEAFARFREAGVQAELHIYARAGHPDGFRPWDDHHANQFHVRFYEWLRTEGLLEAE